MQALAYSLLQMTVLTYKLKMQLQLLENGKHKVASVWDGAVQTTVIDKFLQDVDAMHQASAKGFKVLFQRYAKQGRPGLTAELFHEANKKERIWELIKGRLRIYCFIDSDNNLLLLSHGIVKKNQTTRKNDVRQAVALRDRYLAANQSGTLQWKKRDE